MNLLLNQVRILRFHHMLLILLSLSIPGITKAAIFSPTLQSSKALNINFYLTQGEEHRRNGEFQQSIELFEKALLLADRHHDKNVKLDSLINLGTLYWNIGELELSSKKYSKALAIAQQLKDDSKIIFCSTALLIYENYNRGKEYRSARNFVASIDKFNEAIKLAKSINSREHELKCLRQLSLTYWDNNSIHYFLFYNKESLEIAIELNHYQEQGRCLNNIGIYYWRIDSYSEAMRYFEAALKIARQMGDKEEERNCLTNIGAIYLQLGNYEAALNNFIYASQITKDLAEDSSLTVELNNIGNIFRRKGMLSDNKDDLKRALSYYIESLNIAKKYSDTLTEIDVLNNIGAVYSNLNDYSSSLNSFFAALRKAHDLLDKEKQSFILTNMGIVYAQLGNFEESTKHYQRAIDLALEIKGGKILWEAYLELANSLKRQNNLHAALDNYKKSISVIENIRSGIDLEELKATFLGSERKIEAYYNIIDLLVKLDEKEQKRQYKSEAFHYLERAKARAFLDSIEVSKIDFSEGLSQKLLNREAELMNEISRIHSRLLTPQLSAQKRDEINNELEAYEEQLESLKREMRAASPAYANLRYPQPIGLEEAQKRLIDKDAVVFAYALAKEKSYALAITDKDLKIFSLPDYQKIHTLVRGHLSSITDAANLDFRQGYLLYQILVEPGLDRAKPKKIIFVPDDILYFLPFETLLTKKEGNEWLIKKYEVSYVPSLSALRELIERKKENSERPTKDILALGDPFYGERELDISKGKGTEITANFLSDSDFRFLRLKYSGDEVAKIASYFNPRKKEILLREHATEETFKEKRLSDYRIIHVAAHALINDKKPSRSAIVLSLNQDSREDGFLQMREIFKLKLNADLVALSACHTGLGQLIRGEGIEGLSRAFFYAGASALLLSLWAINDQASSQLLDRFYYHLQSGQSINAALKKAKLELINSGVLSHPYFWGAFIVSGESDKIILPRRFNRWVILTLSLCAGLAILFLWMSYEKNHHLNPAA